MKRIAARLDMSIWTANLTLLAVTVFLNSLGQGVLGGASTNFYINTFGLTGRQVLWMDGIREIPGLVLMFIAALMARIPISRRTAFSLLILGVGYIMHALVGSYTALLGVAVFASIGMHMWMPLHSALSMSLSTKEKTGRVLGALASVGGLASLAGMGSLAVVSRLVQSIPLGTYYIIGGVLIIVAGVLTFKLPTHIGATEVEQPRLLLKGRYWLYYLLTFFEGSRKDVLNTFGTLVLVSNYGFEVWKISLLLMASSIVNMVSAPYMGYLIDHVGERKTLSASYVLLTLCCVGFAVMHNAWLLVGLLILMKLVVMLGMGLNTYVYRLAPAEELTPTLSAGISINHISSVAMPIVAGILLPIIHYEGIFWGTAGLIFLSVPLALALQVPAAAVPHLEPVAAK